MKKDLVKAVFTLLIIATALLADAQELRCNLTVNAQKISGVDPSVFTNMQTALSEFINARAWTTDAIGPEEKIECSMYISLEGSPEQDVYTARITVQSSRPVFNSSYTSPMINYQDGDCRLTYAANQSLDFNVTNYNSNLTSILAYYAYLIIGIDYESFSKGGGKKYFDLAEQIVNNVPNASTDSKGWRPFDGIRNRYWIINNIQSGKYDDFKKVLYEYHYLGLDNFYEKPEEARAAILASLDKLDKIAKDNPNAPVLTLFMQAKADELANIFSGADQSEKVRAVSILKRLDATNAAKYDKILRL